MLAPLLQEHVARRRIRLGGLRVRERGTERHAYRENESYNLAQISHGGLLQTRIPCADVFAAWAARVTADLADRFDAHAREPPA